MLLSSRIRLVYCMLIVFLLFSESSLIYAQGIYQPDLQEQIEKKRNDWQQLLLHHPYANRPFKTKQEWKKLPKKDRPDLAFEQNFLMTMDPALGQVPAERLSIAHDAASSLLLSKAPINGVQWIERGPNNVAGRTRALMFDPNDVSGKKVWAGGVGGGLWYTNDITATEPTWNRINDLWDNIAISTIAYNPANTLEMYVGTGEGFGNGGAQRGEGIWKTTDGGVTWNQLPSTDPGAYNSGSHFHYVVKLVIKGNGNIYAATRGFYSNSGGILRSTDGGNSWTRVLTHYVPSVSRDHATDIEIAANGDLYASFGIGSTGGVYKSLDADQGATGTWINLSSNVGIAGAKRIELACAPSNASVIYAVAHGGADDEDVEWFKKSTDGGTTWSNLTIPLMVDGTGNHFTRSQAWYDLILAVHPGNDQLVIAGGIDLHRSLDGGSTWTGVSHWFGGFGKPEVHADQHAISFRPGFSNEMIFGNDGGVYYSTDAGNSSVPAPGFSNRNHGYNVTQFYACATKNEINSNYFLAGAQDNGTQRFTQPQMNATDEVSGGDGAFCHIDQQNGTIQITQYTFNYVYRSLNNGGSFPAIIQEGTGHFINPSEYDSQNKVYYSATNADSLKRISNMTGAIINENIPIDIGGGKVSALKMSPYGDVLFLGINNGRIYKLSNASSATPVLTRIDNGTSPITNTGWVSSIDVGASDNQLLVTYTNYGVISVWETNTGGTHWNNKEGNLPDMPIRWAIYNPDNRDQVLLATEVGIWSTDNFQPGTAASPDWGPSNAGLAHTRCDMLKYRASDKLVLVATHGRGLFTSDIFVTNTLADFVVDTNFSCSGTLAVQFTDASLRPNGNWAWDVNNDGVVDYTTQNPSHTYTTPGLYTAKLAVDNNASTIVKPNYFLVAAGAPTAATGCTINSNSNLNNNFGIGIKRFELAAIQRTTAHNTGHYNDYSCQNWAVLQANTQYTVGVTTGTANPEGARVYIDWNNNGNLEASESVVTFPSNTSGYRTTTFTTPSSGVVLNTPLRMRVLSKFSGIPSSACDVSTYGQAEDYMVYAIPAPSATLTLGTGNQSICNGQSTSLKVNITGGTSPYTVIIHNGTSNQTITNYTSGTLINISPLATSTYTISSITDILNNPIPSTGSIVITVSNPTSSVTNISSCNSYTWACNGVTYYASGQYTCTQTNANGCIDTTTLNLTINNSNNSSTSATSCNSYTWACNGITYYTSGQYICTQTNANGCIDTTTLNLTINNSNNSSTSATSCNSYTWTCNGTTYYTSGQYFCTQTNANGCIDTTTLNLTINNSNNSSTSATSCNSYTWSCNGITYYTSGQYICTQTNANGCIDTTTLNLTINNSNNSSTSATSCNSYTWACNGITYYTSGQYICTQTNANGCIDTTTLNLTINNSNNSSTSATSCNNYTWACNGITYYTSGQYICTQTNANGCIDTTTLNLTINNSNNSSTSATSCNSYTWACTGTTYYTSGQYTCITSNTNACNDTTTLNLTINTSNNSSTSATSCNSYTWACTGTTYYTSGQYTCITSNTNGCNDTTTLNLTINTSNNSSTSATACNSYTWACTGTTYYTSGQYICTNTNANGCIDTTTLNLTINTSNNSSTSATACNSYTWACTGTTYYNSGQYTCITTNANGCNDTTTLNLTINTSNNSSTSATSCNSYTWACNGNTYYTSGQYFCTQTNANGCNDTTTLNLTINTSNNSSTSATACNSYTWSCNGTTYYTSGQYICTNTNANGCIDTTTLNLTINTSNNSSTSATACNSYTWACNGMTYYTSGQYTCITSNANGCNDTTTLNLTINTSNNSSTSATACNSYTWSCNGMTYYTSGQYICTNTNANGCIDTTTLNLTINTSNNSSTSATACNSYIWACNGTTYYTSGQYTCITTNANGCIDTTTLNLTINTSNNSSTSATACNSYTWACNGMTYYTSGQYTCITSNTNGCNDTTTLNLTINTSNNSSTSATACNSYTWSCNGTTYYTSGQYICTNTNANGCIDTTTLNLTINTSNNSSTSATACNSYTWACTGTTYYSSGQYFCTQTNANGCIDTATLNLTINTSNNSSNSATSCNSYTWACTGTTYYTSGQYTCITSNANGCNDTTTLNLTINNSNNSSTSVTSCNSYTWACNGTTYYTSGQYICTQTNANGCIDTATLNLTINNSNNSSTSVTSCNSYTWACNGNTYYTSGQYTCTQTNANGCVDTTTLVLTMGFASGNQTVANGVGCYTWILNGNTYTQTGLYTATNLNQNGCVVTDTLLLTINPGVSISAKVILSGAYDIGSGLMTDSLRILGLIPLTEPYTASPYFNTAIGGSGGESIQAAILGVSGNNAIIDWVLLELRSMNNPSIIVSNRRALLQADGDIVDTNGTSPVTFNVPAGMYYVSVKHRNHLGVMTSMAVNILPCALNHFDFTSMSVYTNPGISNPPRKLMGSVHCLWSADANHNKNIKYNGLSNDKDAVFVTVGGSNNINAIIFGYRREDCNLDGRVKYNGANNDRLLILQNVGTTTPNAILNQHTPN